MPKWNRAVFFKSGIPSSKDAFKNNISWPDQNSLPLSLLPCCFIKCLLGFCDLENNPIPGFVTTNTYSTSFCALIKKNRLGEFPRGSILKRWYEKTPTRDWKIQEYTD